MPAKRGAGGLGGDPVADRRGDRVPPDDSGEVDAEFAQRHRRQVIVGVDESGQAHPATQVDELGRAVEEARGAVAGAHMDQIAAADHHRLRPGLGGVARPDRSAGEQIGVRHLGTVSL